MPKLKPSHAAKRYWIGYCRKSTDTEDKQVHTLQDQATMITAYYQRLPAQERDGVPLLLLEEARSAYHPGRPVFGRVLEMASRGQVRGIIVVHPNRISRNHADSGAFVQRLVEGQIGSLDTTAGKRYTGADSNDIFMLTLEGAMSWKDSRDKGDRIREAMRMRASEGKHMGPVRIGYRPTYRPDGTKVLEPDPVAAPIIRRLFELAAAGSHSVSDLVREGKRLGLRGRDGATVEKPTIHAILHHPLYKGDIRFDGQISKGRHEPIVDAALWHRVQQVLEGRRTGTPRPKDLSLRDLFVFGNSIRCPKCGRALCPYRARGQYVYYECKNPGTRCRVCVSQTLLTEELARLLARATVEPADLDRLRDNLLRRWQAGVRRWTPQREVLAGELQAVQREIVTVFGRREEAEALGVVDAVDLQLADLKRRRDEIQSRIEAASDSGTGWIGPVIRAFELGNLLQEAILFGTRHPREMSLRAISSNCTVDGKNLVLKLRSPFRECAERGGRSGWCSALFDVRAEIADTVTRLETAWACIQGGSGAI